MIALNAVALVIYVLLLVIILFRLFRKGEHRLARVIIFAILSLVFSKTFSLGFMGPVRDIVSNIEFLVTSDKESIANKDAGRLVSFTSVIGEFPIMNMITAVSIGIFLFYSIYIIRRKTSTVDFKKVKHTTLIVSVGITCIFFKETIQTAIINPVLFLVSRLESSLAYNENASNKIYAGMAGSVSSLVSQFPLAGLIFALGFGILLYQLLMYVDHRRDGQVGETSIQVKNIRALNFTILFILASSLFLVLSVFIAIPYLNEMRKPSVYSASRLDTTLSRIAGQKDSLSMNIAVKLADTLDAADLADVINSEGYRKLSGTPLLGINNQIQTVKNDWSNIMRGRANIINKLSYYTKTYKGGEDAFRQQLLNSFDIASQSLTSDKGNLYEFVVNRFVAYRQAARNSFEKTNESVNENDGYNLTLKQQAITELKSRASQAGSSDSVYSLAYMPMRTFFSTYTSSLYQIEGDSNIQTINKDGSEWGFLGLMSRYLIRTQSSELVLLIGMLGFGLLGASILSFQKAGGGSENFVQAFSTTPLIKDFGSVLARGFGAALIVYLATKGGLAIFAMGGAQSDPNGYILLLTCFVGAVFSEKVWTRISNSLGTQDGRQEPVKDIKEPAKTGA